MMIAREMPLEAILMEIVHRNVKRKAGKRYLQFLFDVYRNVDEDKGFADCLEICLHFDTGAYPTIDDVDRALGKMDGGIRPLLEDKGIVEPMPKVGEV